MFVGEHDDLAVPTDTKTTYDLVKTSFFYKIYPEMDHKSFMLGKNMSFMDDVIRLLNEKNGISEVTVLHQTCGLNEANNKIGENRCLIDSDCNGKRTCSSTGWCQGQSGCTIDQFIY